MNRRTSRISIRRQLRRVLFAEHDGTKAASQIKAFEDTWEWDESAARVYELTVESGGRVADAMRAFLTNPHELDKVMEFLLEKGDSEWRHRLV